MSELEEGSALQIDFKKLARVAEGSPDVVPVAVQNADTREVSWWPTLLSRPWIIPSKPAPPHSGVPPERNYGSRVPPPEKRSSCSR